MVNDMFLKVENVSKVHTDAKRGKGFVALKGIDLEIEKNEFVCIIGPSGCGKTTLLHIMAGFEKPIMHGLCTFGFACRVLIQSLVSGRPEWIRRLACRFSAPLYPGTPIQTLIWKTGKGKAVWQTLNSENGDVVINNGIVEYGAIP